MAYRVILSTTPASVVDEHGSAVFNSFVMQIVYPQEPLATERGTIWRISGPGKAMIWVNGETYVDVPVTINP